MEYSLRRRAAIIYSSIGFGLLTTLTGCGTTPASLDQESTEAVQSTDLADDLEPATQRTVIKTVMSADDLTDLNPTSVSGYLERTPGELDIYLESGDPSCFGYFLELNEDDSSVTIQVSEGLRSDAGDACDTVAYASTVTASLDSPIGTREVIVKNN